MMHSIITRIITVCLLLFPITGISAPAANPADKNLLAAAEKGDLKAVQKAIASGAKIGAQDADGWTPLLFATSKGNVELVMELLKAGADPNQATTKGQTPLMGAVLSGDMVIVGSLLKAKADPLIKLPSGATSIDLARKKGDKTIIAMLETASGSSNQQTTVQQATATKPATSNPVSAEVKATTAQLPALDEAKVRAYLQEKGFDSDLVEKLLKLDVARKRPLPKTLHKIRIVRSMSVKHSVGVVRTDPDKVSTEETEITSPFPGLTIIKNNGEDSNVEYVSIMNTSVLSSSSYGKGASRSSSRLKDISVKQINSPSGNKYLMDTTYSITSTAFSGNGSESYDHRTRGESYSPLAVGNLSISEMEVSYPDGRKRTSKRLCEVKSSFLASTIANSLTGNAYETVCKDSLGGNETKDYYLEDYAYTLNSKKGDVQTTVMVGFELKTTVLSVDIE